MCLKPEGPAILFHNLNRAHHNAITAFMAARQLQDVGQPMILMLLESCENGEIAAQRELADKLHVSPATIATSLKSLEQMGYVKKLADDSDGRRKRVLITEKGRDAVVRCHQVFEDVDRQLYDGFSQEELETIQSLHRRMLANLRSLSGDSPERSKHP